MRQTNTYDEVPWMERKKPRRQPPTMVAVTGELKAFTKAAFLLVKDDHEYWLPKSQCSVPQVDGGFDALDKGDIAMVLVPEWLCEKEDLYGDDE